MVRVVRVVTAAWSWGRISASFRLTTSSSSRHPSIKPETWIPDNIALRPPSSSSKQVLSCTRCPRQIHSPEGWPREVRCLSPFVRFVQVALQAAPQGFLVEHSLASLGSITSSGPSLSFALPPSTDNWSRHDFMCSLLWIPQ